MYNNLRKVLLTYLSYLEHDSNFKKINTPKIDQK